MDCLPNDLKYIIYEYELPRDKMDEVLGEMFLHLSRYMKYCGGCDIRNNCIICLGKPMCYKCYIQLAVGGLVYIRQ